MPIHIAFMPRRLAPALLALLATVSLASPAPAERLPISPSLASAVDFWTRVYSEVDTRAGLIHDSVDLGIVYETVRFSADTSDRERERLVEQAKDRIRATLKKLAKGTRTGLSADEARVLAQFPKDVSNATLRRAAENLRFQRGLSDRFRAGLIRSGRWRKHVEEALERHGVPRELVALPHVESSYDPTAYSRVGAAGMWQFTRSTGRLYMRVDNVIDERLDPYIASDAAARLLAKNYELTGAWPLAITGYNHGAGGMQRAARTLGTTDMGEIVRRYKSRTFGFASRNFYASFMAASRIDRDPARYFGNVTQDAPYEYTTFEVPFYTPADVLAKALGVDFALLREFNPALRPAVWNGSKHVPKRYGLRLPKSSLDAPVDALVANVPGHARFAEQHRDRFHKVGRGETLSKIAGRYGVSEAQLVELNNLRSRHRIRVGQVLALPDGAAGSRPVAAVVQQPLAEDGVYRVQRGDSLGNIARRFGISENELAAANGIRDRHRIVVGQSLRIPGAARPTVLAAAEPVPAPEPKPAAAPKPAPEPKPTAAPEPEVAVATEPEVAVATEPEVAVAPEPTPVVEPTPEPIAAVEPPVAPEPAPAVASEPERAVEPEPEPEPEPPPASPQPGASPQDPSDYSVHGNRIHVQAAETLGHYAEWLEVRASQLRRINGMRFEQPVVIGQRLKLDFARVSPAEFEQRRLEYHQSLQNEFFDAFVVTGTESHVLERGESLWYLAKRKFQVPVWLLRQYNPDLDFAALPAGARLVVPTIEPRKG